MSTSFSCIGGADSKTGHDDTTADQEIPLASSAAAERMRRHRRRRAEGLRCLVILLRETEIDALIRKGLLKEEARNERIALQQALHRFLDRTLNGHV